MRTQTLLEKLKEESDRLLDHTKGNKPMAPPVTTEHKHKQPPESKKKTLLKAAKIVLAT